MHQTTEVNFFLEEVSYGIRQKKALKSWIIRTIISEYRTPGNINIILCSDAYLHKLNVEFLDHDTLTDIITFDYCEDNIVSGDLFISLDRIRDNAEESSTRIFEELHRVIIHGVLHLCGYGDKTPEEKEKMTAKEDLYLFVRPSQLLHQ